MDIVEVARLNTRYDLKVLRPGCSPHEVLCVAFSPPRSGNDSDVTSALMMDSGNLFLAQPRFKPDRSNFITF